MRWPALGLVLLAAACASPSSPEDAASRGHDLTSVTPPRPVQQSVANCWVFATNAWIESMSARPDGAAPVDLSEAYVSFLYWLDQISTPPGPFAGSVFTLRATGSWGNAADLLTRFGWMSEAAFLSVEAPGAYADRHTRAFEAMTKAIAHGDLQTPEARADRARVARALVKAWELTPAVAADLSRAFGDAFDRTLVKGDATIQATRVHRLDEIRVGFSGAAPVTAADLFGTIAPDTQPYEGKRSGPFAYSDVKPPGSEEKVRAYLRRAQLSLVQDLPIVLSETSDDVDIDASGTYRKPVNGVLTDQWYDHAVMAFDLSVQTPDFGLLPAGTPEKRPEAIAASLRDDATVLTFRARNSYWGSYAPGASIAFAGGVAVNDYAIDYLMWRPNFAGGRMLMRATLPNDPDVKIAKAPAP